MGYKKRNPGSKNKHTSGSASDATVTTSLAEVACKDCNVGSVKYKELLPSIKVEYEKALDEIRKGNPTKALKCMRDLSVKYESVGLVHRARGVICSLVGGQAKDPNEKKKHCKNAIASARKAVLLSPESIEFSLFYAKLLFESTNHSKVGYDEIIDECQRALSIQNPIDPAKESSLDEGDPKLGTPGMRIYSIREDLHSLVNRAKLALILNGTISPNDEISDKFQCPNEIKKATKTPEERRREIEASVAAARLLQEKYDLLPSANDKDRDSHSSSGTHTASARCRHLNLQKIASLSDRMDQVRSYWDLMAPEKKQSLLQVSIEDLKSHISSLKDGLMLETLLEALLFARDKDTWKFWVCCCCSEKFTDCTSLVQHVAREHMSSLSPHLHSVLPEQVGMTRASVYFKMLEQPMLNGKVTLSRDSSYLLLNEHSITGDIMCKNGSPPDSNALLSWIFAGSSSREQLKSWTYLKKENTRSALEWLQNHEQIYNRLVQVCEEKLKLLRSEEALLAVESLCVEERKKREHDTRNASRSFEAVFSRRQQELTKTKTESDEMTGNQLELLAISAVLREAQALNVAPFGCEEASTDVLHQSDSSIEVAINTLKVQLSAEISKLDDHICQIDAALLEIETKIESLSSYNFRDIILPLVQSFMRAHLEELVDKAAKEKSEAATEALLAELELEPKKGIHQGGDCKHNQEKMKDKKMKRDHRKAKSLKVNGGNEQHLQKITAEETHFSITSESHPDSQIVGGVSNDGD